MTAGRSKIEPMPSIEISDVRTAPLAGPLVRAFAIDTPAGDTVSESDGFVLSGWVLGEASPIDTVQVAVSGRTLVDLRVNGRRPDVAAVHPDAEAAGRSGFQGWVPTVGLDPAFELEVSAVARSGETVTIGVITGRRWRPAAHPSTPEARTGRGGRLPDFLIIGAQRGGTRVLYDALTRHPQVQPARTDEIHFFSLFFDRGLDWYRAQFPSRPPGQVSGEASPYYLFHPLAARRVHAVAPEVKLIALLRDPVDRAYSHYQLEVRQGVEPLSFEDAIAAEEERLAGEEARIVDDDTYVSFSHQHYSYLARGRYVEQLRRWLARFPRDQMLVVRSEDFYQDAAAVYQRVTDFLGLERHALELGHGADEPSYPPLAPATRRRLTDYFATRNAALSELVGAEIGWSGQ
jgi:hypothetical protein